MGFWATLFAGIQFEFNKEYKLSLILR